MNADRDVFDEFGLGAGGRAAWRDSGLRDDEFESWLVDRVARRPSGAQARAVYGAEQAHDFARHAILGSFQLGRNDRLLDIGCGGGLLLRDALATGATAAGLDHSPEMVRLARTWAPDAEVREGRAEHLPFDDAAFTAVAMSVVFFFLEDPITALRECRRVLAVGGRLAVYTASPQLRGTPAAPEPIAAHGHFYTDEQLTGLAHAAGFVEAAVADSHGAQLLTARTPA